MSQSHKTPSPPPSLLLLRQEEEQKRWEGEKERKGEEWETWKANCLFVAGEVECFLRISEELNGGKKGLIMTRGDFVPIILLCLCIFFKFSIFTLTRKKGINQSIQIRIWVGFNNTSNHLCTKSILPHDRFNLFNFLLRIWGKKEKGVKEGMRE